MVACVVLPLGPACVNIDAVRAGDRNEITFTLSQGGVPLDLTGMTVRAQARKKITDTEPALTAVVTVTDAENGAGVMRWPGDDVATSLAGKAEWTGVWDMKADDGIDDPTTVVEGWFKAKQAVTR